MKHTTTITLLCSALLALTPLPASAEEGPRADLQANLAHRAAMIPMVRLKKIAPGAKARPARRTRRPARRSVGWGSGERMTYRVALAGVWGGRAALSVGKQHRKGRRRYLKIRGLGETVPFISLIRKMSEDMTTTLWLDGLSPRRQVADRRMPNKDRVLETHFDDPVRQTLTRQGKTFHRIRAIGRPYLDPISALFSLRSVSLKKGRTFTMRVVNGTSMMLVEARVLGRRRVHIGKKSYDTILVQGVGRKIRDDGAPWPGKMPRLFAIWFTRGRARIPVKVMGDTMVGKLEAELSSYRPPRHSLRVSVAGL